MSSKPSKRPLKRPPARFLIYKNPLADTWRVDLSVPVLDLDHPSGHAYVGTIRRIIDADGTVTYSGPIRALDSAVLQRDIGLASRQPGPPTPALLILSEVSASSSRQRRKRLTATLILASGRFRVDAHYAEGEIHIIGKIKPDNDKSPTPDVGEARRRATLRSARAGKSKPNRENG